MNLIIHVGLDVHNEPIAVSIASGESREEWGRGGADLCASAVKEPGQDNARSSRTAF